MTVTDLPFLEVRKLNVRYRLPGAVVWAVRDFSFQLIQGETTALVGETGSGKSTVALSLLGLLQSEAQVEAEAILLEGRELSRLAEGEWRKLRGRRLGLIFQDARGALNPVLTVGEHLIESLRAHRRLSRKVARKLAIDLLLEVGIPEPESQFGRYSFELSGGMCQRIGIAMAIANNPGFLIADEPTSALDPTIQSQIFALLFEMRRRHGLTLLLISHDLALVSESADRVMVMYHGRLVELGLREDVLAHPAHPYTRALIQCQPGFDHHSETRPLIEISGSAPGPDHEPKGCAFFARCSQADDKCVASVPDVVNLSETHSAACFRARGTVFDTGQTS